MSGFLIVVHGTFGRRLVTHLHRFGFLEDEIFIDLNDTIFFAETVRRTSLRVEQPIFKRVIVSIKRLRECIHGSDLFHQIFPEI